MFRVLWLQRRSALQMQECTCHPLSGLIKLFAVIVLFFVIAFGWNHQRPVWGFRLCKERTRVITVVGQILSGKAVNQESCLRTICCDPLCNNSPDQQTMCIHRKM